MIAEAVIGVDGSAAAKLALNDLVLLRHVLKRVDFNALELFLQLQFFLEVFLHNVRRKARHLIGELWLLLLRYQLLLYYLLLADYLLLGPGRLLGGNLVCLELACGLSGELAWF